MAQKGMGGRVERHSDGCRPGRSGRKNVVEVEEFWRIRPKSPRRVKKQDACVTGSGIQARQAPDSTYMPARQEITENFLTDGG